MIRRAYIIHFIFNSDADAVYFRKSETGVDFFFYI
jgi:hypothetical protein